MAEEVYNAGNADTDNITSKVMDSAVASDDGKSLNLGGDNKSGRPDPSTLKVDEDGIIEYITPDMIIGDIITWYPDASLVLMKCGMHCISCGVSQFETLDQACAVHGLYTDDVAKVVNDYLTQTLGDKKTEE
ncbi:hybrid cluster protein-associated redox disulfide domain-containing protein [Lachnospiraceae bacterium NE2001]|jgi:hybrid cluster-associated redox disulfide protein|nr:hybrid cluster protein-associated redox disulfide domain-containing protein [Lachnospiraceae bacterium NE2001]